MLQAEAIWLAIADISGYTMHGPAAIVEQILDWRPYDYWSNRSTIPTPDGPLTMLNTVELEPTTSGTTIHFRYAAPKSAKERAILQRGEPTFRATFEASGVAIARQLEAELAARAVDDVPADEGPTA